jgi:hypothetical protein
MVDHIKPVSILTEATLEMEILSSLEPKKRGFIRMTRSGVTSIRTGNNKLPAVNLLAVNTLFLSVMVSFPRRT